MVKAKPRISPNHIIHEILKEPKQDYTGSASLGSSGVKHRFKPPAWLAKARMPPSLGALMHVTSSRNIGQDGDVLNQRNSNDVHTYMPWHSVLATCPCFGTLHNPFKLCQIPSDQWICVFLTMMLRSNNGCTMVYTLIFTSMYWTNIWLTPYAFWQLKLEVKKTSWRLVVYSM